MIRDKFVEIRFPLGSRFAQDDGGFGCVKLGGGFFSVEVVGDPVDEALDEVCSLELSHPAPGGFFAVLKLPKMGAPNPDKELVDVVSNGNVLIGANKCHLAPTQADIDVEESDHDVQGELFQHGYLRVFDNETETIELVLKKEPGWADLLTPESHAALMDQIQELNLPFLAGWAQRRMARGKALQPDFTERMEKAMLDAATAPALAGSLPASAPDAATPPPAPLS